MAHLGGAHKADEYSQRRFVVPYVCMGKPCALKGVPDHPVRLANQLRQIASLLDAMGASATLLNAFDS